MYLLGKHRSEKKKYN